MSAIQRGVSPARVEKSQELVDRRRLEEEYASDFENMAVPAAARKSFFSLTIVWTGFVFLITSMIAGGGLVSGLDLYQVVLASILGNVFLSVVAVLIAIISSKSGLSFALITRFSFGAKGSKLATLFVPVVNIGWYTIQSATYGHFISSIFGITGLAEVGIMFLCAIGMGLFALVGIRALTILGYIAIPAIIYLSLGAAFKATSIGGLEHLVNYVPPMDISLVEGMGIVIGTWILSTATCIADIMRFAKSTKQAVCSTVLGLILGNSLLIICGAVAAIGTGNSDLCDMLKSLGLVIPAFILMTTNLFTTNATNLYSTSLNLANTIHLDRRKLIVGILVICGLLTFTRPHEVENFFVFLNFLGVVVPPLAGIILADYYFVHKGRYDSLEKAEEMSYSLAPWLTWAISLVFVFMIDWGLTALNGIVISMLLYPILHKVCNTGVARKSKAEGLGTQSQIADLQSSAAQPLSVDPQGVASYQGARAPQTAPARKNLALYVVFALIGVIVMGLGSFMSCLALSFTYQLAGNILLLASLPLTGWAFYKWQP